MKKIYLACPYSIFPEACFIEANRKAAQFMLEGNIVFSPISHGHSITKQESLLNSHEFWMMQNLSFIDWCDELYVLQLPHWETSKGVKTEIEYAIKLGKSIKYIII
jgi:nucleoside 2-deoxyribosyltransferase